MDSFLGEEGDRQQFTREFGEAQGENIKECPESDTGKAFWILLHVHDRFDWSGIAGIIGQGRSVAFSNVFDLVHILKDL